MKQLIDKGYLYLENFLESDYCDIIINEYRKAEKGELPQTSANLNDSSDFTNCIYKSERSPMQYCYLESEEAQRINHIGRDRLEEITRMSWSGNINERCFPIFEYHENGFIKAHRGRNVGYGKNDFVAVLMLTDHSIDFLGGEFYLNKNAEASEDGKIIFNESEEDRIYFKQRKGSIVIFNNPIHVHGTVPVVKSVHGMANRITTSWRMEKK